MYVSNISIIQHKKLRLETSYVRVKDGKLCLFSFSFVLFFENSGLEFSMILHMTQYYTSITCHGHMIIYYIKHCRKFQSNNIILHVPLG